MGITKRLTATAGIGLASVLMIAGCSSPDPSAEVKEAFENQQKVSAQSMTFSMDIEPSKFADMLESMEDENDDTMDDGMDRRMAEQLAGMKLTVESKSKDGTPLKDNLDITNMDWGLFVDSSDSRIISVLNVDNGYFLKADVENIFSMLDVEGFDYNQFSQMADQFPGDSAWIASLLGNEWITPDEALTQTMTEGIKENDTVKTLDEQEEAKKAAMDRVSESAFTKSDFTRNGDTITMSIPLKEVMSENREDVELLMDDGNEEVVMDDDLAGDSRDVGELIEDMNDNKFNVDFKIEDKHFTQVKVDPIQLTHIIEPSDDMDDTERAEYEKMKENSLPLTIDFSRSTDNLTVPEGAATVTEDSIGMLMMFMMMGSNPELEDMGSMDDFEITEDDTVNG